MPWCPNCKYEYEEDIEKCSDCGADLVPELPFEDTDLPDDTLDSDLHSPDDIIHLTSVNSTMQADLVESQLRAFGVPVTKNYSNPFASNTLMMGYNNLGVDIYVPLELYDKALQILQSPADITEEDINAEVVDSKDQIDKTLWVKSGSKYHKFNVPLITVFAIIVGIAALLYAIFNFHK